MTVTRIPAIGDVVLVRGGSKPYEGAIDNVSRDKYGEITYVKVQRDTFFGKRSEWVWVFDVQYLLSPEENRYSGVMHVPEGVKIPSPVA